MGKKLLILLILILIAFVGFTKYNQMVTMEKGLKSQWVLIESIYEDKSDVIFSISRMLDNELAEDNPIFNQVLSIRNNAAQVKVEVDDVTEESIQLFRTAYQQLIAIQSDLLDIANQHPQIISDQEFRELKTELEGTEIRISNERRRLNEQVDNYNKYVNGFFNIAIAQVFGFNDWPTFSPILGE